MKDKILTFIIGVLVGAIIASIGYYFYHKNNRSGQMPNGAPPQMMQNGNSTGMPSGTPPELPSGENTDSNNGDSTSTKNTTQTKTNQ